jgi:hypothetical protein
MNSNDLFMTWDSCYHDVVFRRLVASDGDLPRTSNREREVWGNDRVNSVFMFKLLNLQSGIVYIQSKQSGHPSGMFRKTVKVVIQCTSQKSNP